MIGIFDDKIKVLMEELHEFCKRHGVGPEPFSLEVGTWTVRVVPPPDCSGFYSVKAIQEVTVDFDPSKAKRRK